MKGKIILLIIRAGSRWAINKIEAVRAKKTEKSDP